MRSRPQHRRQSYMDVSQRGLPHRYRSGELYAGVYASLNWWNNYLTAPGFSRYDRWVAQYYSECQYKGSYGIWQYISTWSIGGKDFDGNWAYKDYPSIVKAMTGEKTPEKEEDDMTAEEVKKIALEAIQEYVAAQAKKDTPEWVKSAVEEVKAAKVMNGDDTGAFRLESTVKRESWPRPSSTTPIPNCWQTGWRRSWRTCWRIGSNTESPWAPYWYSEAFLVFADHW